MGFKDLGGYNQMVTMSFNKNIDRSDLQMRLDNVKHHIGLIGCRYRDCPKRLQQALHDALMALELRKRNLLENIHNEKYKFQA